jgi:hypothetical protein
LLGDAGIVRDEHERHVLFTMKPKKEFEDKTCILAVEVAGGFVREQNGRTIGQAAGYRGALPLATGRVEVAEVAAAKVAAPIDER